MIIEDKEGGVLMDIAKIPIVDFLKYCQEGAKREGYYWIVCILSRKRDSKNLYKSIESDWKSLDSITGSRILVLFAGNEVDDSHLSEQDLGRFCITDNRKSYIRRYNPFATFIGTNTDIKTDLSSVRYEILQKHILNVEDNQTDAIDSLCRYFDIEEQKIPCLVYMPVIQNSPGVQKTVVSFPKGEIDLYRYFKSLFNRIAPMIDELNNMDEEIAHRIETAYQELESLANTSAQREEIMRSIQDRQYLKCDQPIRGKQSGYIDKCKNYEKKTGTASCKNRKSELISEIEKAFSDTEIPLVEPLPVNANISFGDHNRIIIGNNNKIKNSTIVGTTNKSDNPKSNGFFEKHPVVCSVLISFGVGFVLLFSFWNRIITFIEGLF